MKENIDKRKKDRGENTNSTNDDDDNASEHVNCRNKKKGRPYKETKQKQNYK